MDHTIDNLHQCIFDYLITRENVHVSVQEIFFHITQPFGHRCSALKKDNLQHYNKFLSICYNMHINYKNIRKYFKYDTCYLVYSINKYDQLVNSQSSIHIPSCFSLKEEENELTFTPVQKDKFSNFEKLLNEQNICIDTEYQELISFAIENKHYFMIYEMVDLLIANNKKKSCIQHVILPESDNNLQLRIFLCQLLMFITFLFFFIIKY